MKAAIRWLMGLDVLRRVMKIAIDQQQVIQDQRSIIESLDAEIVRLKVEYSRWGRDMIEEFLIGLDKDEDELRSRLVDGLEDMRDEVSRMEEYS